MSTVLIVSPVPVLPRTAGNRARIGTLADALESLGHTVVFMHVLREAGDQTAMRERFADRYVPVAYRQPRLRGARVKRILRRLGIDAAWRYPLDAWYDPATDAALDMLFSSSDIDVAVVEYAFMSRALLRVPEGVAKVLDTHDVFTDRHRRYLDSDQTPRWFSCSRADEAAALDRADRVLAIQDGEAEWFRSLTERPVATVGHLVTIDPLPDSSSGERVLIVGSANPINVDSTAWFLDEVAPLIRARRPAVQIALAGSLCNSFSSRSGVVLLGAFGDLEEVYGAAQVVVNPMRLGTGLKIKTIEALGLGRATVTSPAGASGLEGAAGDAFMVAHDAAEFADQVVRLLADPPARRALAARAIAFARSWNEACLAGLATILTAESTPDGRVRL
jgi:hypothetical protein